MQHFTRVVAMLCLATCGCAAAANADVQQQLAGALTCEGSPLDTVRELAAAGSGSFAKGYAGYEFGEEMDSVSGLVLKEPLLIGAARTSHVVASLGSFHYGFNGHVFARFEGDPAAVIESLKLIRSDQPESESFVRPVPTEDPDDVCPPTIELKALDGGGFLLGCGWCNG